MEGQEFLIFRPPPSVPPLPAGGAASVSDPSQKRAWGQRFCEESLTTADSSSFFHYLLQRRKLHLFQSIPTARHPTVQRTGMAHQGVSTDQ